MKLRLEAIKRGQEEAAAKVALENKEAATENYEAAKENKEAVIENKEAAKVTLENKETVLEKETEEEQTGRIANEQTNEPAAKENKEGEVVECKCIVFLFFSLECHLRKY